LSIVGPDGRELGRLVLEDEGAPDISFVDTVARLALLARRLGGDVVVADGSTALAELLLLAGLGVEVKWQPELGKESLGFQEGQKEGHFGDPAL
jgi:hypothetical protein